MADSEKGALLPEILRDGYGYSPKKITRDASLSIEAKAIYAYLASFADENGIAYPGIELMCHELNISEKRFHRHKKQLIDQGFITVERERTDNGWSNNIYTLIGYSVTSHFVPLQNVPLRNVPLQNVTLQNDPTIITSLNNTSLNNTSLNNTSLKEKQFVEQKPDPIPYREIIDYLNQKAGKNYKHTAAGNKKVIKARWKEGCRLDQFKRVVDNKCQDWLNDENMNQYLRPATLFGQKFDQYYNQKNKKESVNEYEFLGF
nr:conserved phage C-terminal domain-containing protein [uncultured Trichococcus sp.]